MTFHNPAPTQVFLLQNAKPTLRETGRDAGSSQWIIYFAVCQIVLQLALLVSWMNPLRVPIRVAAFGLSLAYLGKAGVKAHRHPAAKFISAVLILLVLCLSNSHLNTVTAGVGQILLYAAIAAPLFWVSKFKPDLGALQKVLFLMWCFHTASSTFGILQTEFPGHFQPALSTSVQALGQYIDGLYITTNDGARVFRPMGLTDQPGGAAMSAFYSILLGLGLCIKARESALKVAAALSIGAGCTCLYLCQIRSLTILAAICMVSVCLMLSKRGRAVEVVSLFAVAATAIVLGFFWATSLAGNAVTERLATLTEDSAVNVYHSNRGIYLDDTINMLPDYPFGAGLGRWGMTNQYFGDNTNPETESIWVEIQLTGWLLDGGIPLIVAYSIAVLTALGIAFRVAASPPTSDLWLWATIVFSFDIAIVAVTFNYPVFISQTGMEFWLINAILYSAWQTQKREERIVASGQR